ncbi:unnamed protein product, partial [Closterium sp. NIES-53]
MTVSLLYFGTTSSAGAGAGGAGTGGASSRSAGARVSCAKGAGTEELGAGGSPTASPTAPPHRHDTRFQALRRLECEEQEQLDQEWQELQQRCPLGARPLSPLANLRTVLFCSPSRRSLPMYVLHSLPASSLTISSHPITDYYLATRLVVFRVLASLVTDPRASPSSVSALTATVADFASTCHLVYATRVVAPPPPHPLSVG